MTVPQPKIIAVGHVDRDGIAGSAGVRVAWSELGVAAPGRGSTPRTVFGRRDDTFRRLDRQSRSLALAAMASGLEGVLDGGARAGAALVTETRRGSLEVDLQYVGGLREGIVQASIFPYTLLSSCAGEVALRHGLRGPTLCLSVEPGEEGAALVEAQDMLAAGEARHAVVGSVEALAHEVPGVDAALRAAVVVLAPTDDPRPPVASWPLPAADPYGDLVREWLEREPARRGS